MAGGIVEMRPATMSTIKYLSCLALVLFVSGLFAGCGSTEGGGHVSASLYYGTGFYDPWYYGGYYDDPDIIVTPPPNRPEAPVRPEQPIYHPDPPRPTPMPSIPSAPRPAARPAMRR
jgi:hypothetical protein